MSRFVEVDGAPGRRLLVRADRREAVLAAGLLDPARWEAALGGGGSGRGRAGRVTLSDGPVWGKRMRRGGAVGRLWRDRFPGRDRLVQNVTVAEEAVARGVPTPSPVALLTAEGPPGLFRAWLATEWLEGARDLATLLRERTAGPTELAAALAAVRAMHDAGVEHPDLNLGNLLVRQTDTVPRAFVVDLDRARLRRRGLSARLRQTALRRLERSHAKLFGTAGPFGGDGAVWYEVYAGSDALLSAYLTAGRPAGRLRLAVHRTLGHRRVR
jgi:3-deoxy-D-manno-octulosonic acid kinase